MLPRLLLVDDDESTILYLQTYLQSIGYSTVTAGTALDMKRKLNSQEFQGIVLDMHLPDGDGVELIEEIHRDFSDVPVIIITAFGSIERAVEAMRRGAYDFCIKPIEENRLAVTLKNAIERADLKRKVQTLEKTRRTEFCGLIGGSAEIQVVYHIIETVASTKASVLITGESGTGKELIARAIHQLSNRRSHALVDVNCAAIPKDLLESELFGHEKSAFTGAHRQYIGRCEQADQGTLFLDEIAEMDINLQPKLLRFLQERVLYRVGGKQRIPVDTRVISATNKDPMEAIQNNHLREDLYYRLNVVNIQVPPLRKRVDDIPELAWHFLTKFSQENDKNFQSLSPDAESALCGYSWPGNVRELENSIHHAVVLHRGPVLERRMLPEPMCGKSAPTINMETRPQMPTWVASPSVSSASVQEIIPLETMEKQAIKQALCLTRGNVSKAAEGLKLSQATLYRKIRDYGFNPRDFKIGDVTLKEEETCDQES